MKLVKKIYENITKTEAPYYYNYSILKIIGKPIRKWLCQTVAYNCPFNCIRIFIYKICGFKIGKHVFIGMHCYLDDMCYNLITIGNNVTISYGVYFACHGKNQKHLPIIIKDYAYIGMRANVLSNNKNHKRKGIIIEENAIIGACSLINQDVPDDSTAVGVPCRILERKNNNE